MAGRLIGTVDWEGARDAEGYREYTLTSLVSSLVTDGPFVILNTIGLPRPGDLWIVGSGAERDLWVWCRAEALVRPVVIEESNTHWTVEQKFSNKPVSPERQRCQDTSIEDPLLEPPKLSGSFIKAAREAMFNRFGTRLTYSSHEQITGQQVEFDEANPQIVIEQNVRLLNLALLCQMMNTVNDGYLWGLPPRLVKLADASWAGLYYGQCYRYFKRTLTYEINWHTWDRDILDEGTKVLKGHWGDGGSEGAGWVLEKINGSDPDPNNPSHFIRALGRDDSPMKMVLDGAGKPAVNVGHRISSLSIGGTSTRITTATSHGLVLGETVSLIGLDPPYWDGDYTVTEILSTTEFRIENPISGTLTYDSGGTVYRKGSGPGNRHVEYYREMNQFRLGIPVRVDI